MKIIRKWSDMPISLRLHIECSEQLLFVRWLFVDESMLAVHLKCGFSWTPKQLFHDLGYRVMPMKKKNSRHTRLIRWPMIVARASPRDIDPDGPSRKRNTRSQWYFRAFLPEIPPCRLTSVSCERSKRWLDIFSSIPMQILKSAWRTLQNRISNGFFLIAAEMHRS